MKPWIHARNSARKFGGKPGDYIAIHNFFDWSKSTIGDIRHRVILHNTFGCFLAERLFGYPEDNLVEQAQKFDWSEEEVEAIRQLMDDARSSETTYIINSDGKRVQIRDVAEAHCIEDMGCVPTVADCLHMLPVHGWLRKNVVKIVKMLD